MQDLDRRSRARRPGRLATAAAGPSAPGRPGSRSSPSSRWVALALLASAQLMLVLDVTVVNVALPDIGAALHLHRSELPWVLTIYTLFFGGLMLLGGRLADLFGPRRMTLLGLALFTISSLVCGLAPAGVMLLAGRSVQGLSAALMSPAALATVLALFPGADRGKALGVWSALAGAGSALASSSAGCSPPRSAGGGCSPSTCRSASPCSSPYHWPCPPGSGPVRPSAASTSPARCWSPPGPVRPSTG